MMLISRKRQHDDRAVDEAGPAKFIRYTPAKQESEFGSGTKQRIIGMVQVQKDPMEPPR